MVRLIGEVGATICYTAPTFYRQMAPFAKAVGIPSLRLCVSAGEGLPDATRTLWREATGIEMIDGIGATEMFHIFISSAGAEVRHAAIGKVVPGYTAKVVNDVGVEVPRGTVGKLAVIGPTGCKYLGDERQTRYVKDGWNYPGDAFVQDADGYFFYQARDDDMIITAGYNVGGPEVEDALLRHPAVAECAVIGLPDEARGMIVKAFCVLKPGLHRRRGDGAHAAGTRQGDHRAVQVPTPDRVPRHAAAHRNRQIATFQAEDAMKILQPPGWATPKGYANGVAARGTLVFVGGQIGWNAQQQFETDDFIAQTAQTLRNVHAVLAEAGAGPEHMVRMTWYVTSREEYLRRLPELGAAYRTVMGRNFPAMTCVEVSALMEARAQIEIEVTAVVPDPR
jgi:enamine deaminase RidA (YjgF/YER057c/UK114 family)